MLYYIHGYLSEPDSTKGTLFRKTLDIKPIKYRDCEPEDVIISDCIRRIEEEIKNDKDVILIGSSLGGFLAAKTALDNPNVKHIILLNPAIIPIDFDISKIKDMPQRILREMRHERLFNEKIKSKISILAGIMDDVVPLDWIKKFAKAQEISVNFFIDDHRFSYTLNHLPGIITSLLDKNIKK